MLKIERDLTLTIFPLEATIWQRFTNILVYDHTTRKKNPESLDLRGQTLSGKDSTWMVDLLKIPRVVDYPFYLMINLFFYYIIKLP